MGYFEDVRRVEAKNTERGWMIRLDGGFWERIGYTGRALWCDVKRYLEELYPDALVGPPDW